MARTKVFASAGGGDRVSNRFKPAKIGMAYLEDMKKNDKFQASGHIDGS